GELFELLDLDSEIEVLVMDEQKLGGKSRSRRSSTDGHYSKMKAELELQRN
ncbi:unnamed protein product, partial [Amoebophrya sp. A25]